MIRWAVVLMLCLGAWPASATTPQERMAGGHVRVRVGTEPGRQVVVGQQTRFFVEILTDTWFTKAPRYPELNLDGAIVLMPEQLGTNFTERIDGETFAVQRRSYVVFPQRPGVLEIPSIRVRLGVAEGGRSSTPFTLRTAPIRLRVVVPPAAQRVDPLVTTPRLSVREDWSQPLEGLRAGDAIRRTVRLQADEVLGMLLPDLAFAAPDGIAVYPDQARIEDTVNRGRYAGTRVESTTYVLQEAGEFTLPAIEFHWWQPTTGRLMTETLAARSFEVEGAAPIRFEPPVDRLALLRRRLEEAWWLAREHGWIVLGATIGIVLSAWFLRRVVPLGAAHARAAARRRRDSEARRYRQLRRSLRGGSADALVADYWRWRDRLAQEITALRPDVVVGIAERTGFSAAWAGFERGRYGDIPGLPVIASVRIPLRAFRAAVLAESRREQGPAPIERLNPLAEQRWNRSGCDRMRSR